MMTKKCIAHLPMQRKYEEAQIRTRLAAVWAIRVRTVTIVTAPFRLFSRHRKQTLKTNENNTLADELLWADK